MLLFNFRSKRMRSAVRRWVKKLCVLEYRDRDRHRAGFRQQLHELQVTPRWDPTLRATPRWDPTDPPCTSCRSCGTAGSSPISST